MRPLHADARLRARFLRAALAVHLRARLGRALLRQRSEVTCALTSAIFPSVRLSSSVSCCLSDLNVCSQQQPCQNGATCVIQDSGDFTCLCPQGFHGNNCQQRTGPCHQRRCELLLWRTHTNTLPLPIKQQRVSCFS